MSKPKDSHHEHHEQRRTGHPQGHQAESETPAERREPIELDDDVAGPNSGTIEVPRSELEGLQNQLVEKERELAELQDKYLRALADSENIRKRVRQQSEESIRIQRENLLRDLLPVIDNLERAVEAARGGGNGKSIVEGVEMVLRSLLDFLKAQGVTPVAAVGQRFDPQLHEAVDQVASDKHPPNTVLSEFHRGYAIGDRMLRPARVSVVAGGGGSLSDNLKQSKDDCPDIEKN